MNFVATAPTADKTPAGLIANDGFFPDIDIEDARQALRVDGSVTEARLRQALTAAVIEVGNDLAVWQASMRAAGRTALASVPGPRIDGKTRQELAYIRAVYCLANADLIERMIGYDVTGANLKRAEVQEETPDALRRNARWAVADVQGLRRVRAELL